MLFSSCNDFLDTLPKGKVIPTTVEDFGNLMKDMTLSTAYDGLPYYCSDDVLIPNRSINMSNATNKAYFWAHLQSSVFKLSKDLIDSIHEEGIVAYTS